MTQQQQIPEDIIRSNIDMVLPVKLTRDEKLEIHEHRVKLEAELEEAEKDFERVKSDGKKKIEALEDRVAAMGKEIRDGEQRRHVTCYHRLRGSTVELVRTDTKTVVDSWAATAEEMQLPLPDAKTAEEQAAEAEQRDAAQVQKDANVEESDDGDVVVPDGSDELGKKRKAKK